MKRLCGLAALLAGAFFAVGCAGTDPSGDHVIKMTGLLKYQPAELTVKAGETVQWKNESIVTHTVTADPSLAKKAGDAAVPQGAQTFNSGDVPPGKSFSYTFTTPGTYKYFCIPHESMGMLGVINVTAPSAKP